MVHTIHQYIAQDLQEPLTFAFAGGEVAVLSRRAPGKASSNEDAAALIEVSKGCAALVVADGCGGMSDGDAASRLAIESICQSIEGAADTEFGLRAAILDGIERANQKVRDLGSGAATTLVAVELVDPTVRSFHAGDSQVLLVGNRGKVKLQTQSHSPVGYAIEAGVLSEEEAIHHEDRHIVSNVIGSENAHIEVGPRRKLSARDTLLIASDGLFDNLYTEEIVEFIRKGPLEKSATNLAACACRRMDGSYEEHPCKPDDLTFVLFRRSQSVKK